MAMYLIKQTSCSFNVLNNPTLVLSCIVGKHTAKSTQLQPCPTAQGTVKLHGVCITRYRVMNHFPSKSTM